MRHHQLWLAGLVLGFVLSGPAVGFAQPVPLSLPVPSDEPVTGRAPKQVTKAKKPTRTTAKKTTRPTKENDAFALPAEPAAPARPKRFVPAEFDDDADAGGSARPFVTPSGRAGLGMRF